MSIDASRLQQLQNGQWVPGAEGRSLIPEAMESHKAERRAPRIRLDGGVGNTSVTEDSEEWRDLAACRGPQAVLFFASGFGIERKDERLERETRAKAFCASCKVVESCLDYAAKTRQEQGVWGGLGEDDRRSMRRRN